MLKTVSSIVNAIGALNYKGTWDANTNTPTLVSSVGTKGDYYVVSVAGSTNLNGETNWGVGDWAVFNGSVWQKVDGGSTGNFTDITVSNSATLSYGTVNGVAYLNGSKVLTTGSALTFDGTNLGIGTSSPTLLFQVGSRGGMTSNGVFQWGSALTGNNRGVLSWDTNIAIIGAAQNLVFCANSETTERMRLDSSGNLGIGTSSPSSTLDVRTSTGATIIAGRTSNVGATSQPGAFNITAPNASGSARTWAGIRAVVGTATTGSESSSIIFSNQVAGAYTDTLTINSSGNLGLGVTPSAWATVNAYQVGRASIYGYAGVDSGFQHNAYFNAGWKYAANDFATQYQQVSGIHRWFTAASGTAGNAISFTQAMTLDASSRLLIGTTSVGIGNNNATALTVANGTATVYQSIRASGGEELYCYAASGSLGLYSYTNHPLIFGTNNAERARIPSTGGFVVGTAALATNATTGFLYVPTCAGTPTGTPATQTGTAPIVVDTTNNKLYFYSGGQWRDAGP